MKMLKPDLAAMDDSEIVPVGTWWMLMDVGVPVSEILALLVVLVVKPDGTNVIGEALPLGCVFANVPEAEADAEGLDGAASVESGRLTGAAEADAEAEAKLFRPNA